MRDIIDAIDAGDVAAVRQTLDDNPTQIQFSPFGDSPLHMATSSGRTEIVRLLVERGADVSARGVNGLSPLHLAVVRGNCEIAQYLVLNHADLDALDDEGMSALMLAARQQARDIAKLLIQAGAHHDVMTAICLGDVDRVRKIIAQSPRAIEESRFCRDALVDAVISNVTELVQFLLVECRIDANLCDKNGDPPLVCAVSSSDYNPEIVRLLLGHGANPRQQGGSGDDAYSRASDVEIPDVEQLLGPR